MNISNNTPNTNFGALVYHPKHINEISRKICDGTNKIESVALLKNEVGDTKYFDVLVGKNLNYSIIDKDSNIILGKDITAQHIKMNNQNYVMLSDNKDRFVQLDYGCEKNSIENAISTTNFINRISTKEILYAIITKLLDKAKEFDEFFKFS